MPKRTPLNLISPRRIFDELAAKRTRPDAKSPRFREDLQNVRVFRGDNHQHSDQTLVMSARRIETGDRFLAVCHTNSALFSRSRGLSRVFYELPLPAVTQGHEPWVTPLPIECANTFRFVRASVEPERLLRFEVAFDTTEKPELISFGNLEEIRPDIAKNYLFHGALFSITGPSAKTDWEQAFSKAVDLLEASKFQEGLEDLERIDKLMTAKDIFETLGRTALHTDCLVQIAKIIAADYNRKQDLLFRSMALRGLARATQYYQSVGDTHALAYVKLTLQNLTAPRSTRIR